MSPRNETEEDLQNEREVADVLPENMIIVEKSVIGGRDASITIYS